MKNHKSYWLGPRDTILPNPLSLDKITPQSHYDNPGRPLLVRIIHCSLKIFSFLCVCVCVCMIYDTFGGVSVGMLLLFVLTFFFKILLSPFGCLVEGDFFYKSLQRS